MSERATVVESRLEHQQSWPELRALAEATEVMDASPACGEATANGGGIPAKNFVGTWRSVRSGRVAQSGHHCVHNGHYASYWG